MKFFLMIIILHNLLDSVQLLLRLSPGIRFGVITTATLIREHGYDVETLNVTTEDGYKLKMFYMPPSRHCQRSEIKGPVLLMHGLLTCSDSWVLNGPDDALAFLLADNCHPVYLGNSRSNVYGRKHETLSRFDPNFWKFSHQEIGYYDVAAMVRLIRKAHNNSSISYVGQSQGGSVLLVLLSERPEFNEWIKSSYLLAPGIYIHNTLLPASIIRPIGCTPLLPVNFPAGLLGGPAVQLFAQNLCWQIGGNGIEICVKFPLIDLIFTDIFNKSVLPMLGYNHPAGCSVREIKHLLQGYCNEKFDFKKYNYGPEKNLLVYGSTDPPPFNLTNITSKIVIYYGSKDYITVPSGVERACAENPRWACNLVKNYNHLDLLFALNVREKVFQPIIDDINLQ